jgi:hypothetical protein
MSTKTLRKRIALVAVAALGAGVLSVAPASAATSGFTYAEFQFSLALSQRVCKDITDQDGTGDSNLTKVGEVLSNGTIHFAGASSNAFDSAVGDSFTVQITGPAVFGTVTQDGSVPATPVYSGTNGTTLTFLSSADQAAQLPTVLTVNATGAGVIQVAFSKTDSGTSTDIETYTFASVTSCSAGVANVGNSFIRTMFYGSDGTLGSSTSPASNVTEYTAADTTSGSASLKDSADRIANGGTGRVAMRVMDGATTPAVITTAGVFSASATNGAVIGWDTTALALQSSSATEAVSAGAQANVLYVTQGLANKDKPMSTVVTLYYNGVEYGKRTITFTGKASKLVINADSSSAAKSNNATNLLAGSYSILDAAGNDLTADGEGVGVSTDVVNSPLLITDSYAVIVDSAKDVVTAIGSVGTEANEENGYFGWSCGANKGTAKIYLKYIMADTTTLVSNTYDAACYGGAVNYKASLDKASYAPGEIATLTITATDSAGNPVYDVDDAGVGVDLGTLAKSPEISLPSLTAVSTPTWSDEFSAGKKTYKFTVGATEGTFQGVVNLPNINNTTYAQVAQTIGYKVAGSAGVTNADVLKAIVSLIASINKQIAALQKALLKK